MYILYHIVIDIPRNDIHYYIEHSRYIECIGTYWEYFVCRNSSLMLSDYRRRIAPKLGLENGRRLIIVPLYCFGGYTMGSFLIRHLPWE